MVISWLALSIIDKSIKADAISVWYMLVVLYVPIDTLCNSQMHFLFFFIVATAECCYEFFYLARTIAISFSRNDLLPNYARARARRSWLQFSCTIIYNHHWFTFFPIYAVPIDCIKIISQWTLFIKKNVISFVKEEFFIPIFCHVVKFH